MSNAKSFTKKFVTVTTFQGVLFQQLCRKKQDCIFFYIFKIMNFLRQGLCRIERKTPLGMFEKKLAAEIRSHTQVKIGAFLRQSVLQW